MGIDMNMPSVSQAKRRAVISWAFHSAATMGIGISGYAASNNLLLCASVLAAMFTARSMNTHERIIRNIKANKAQRNRGFWDL